MSKSNERRIQLLENKLEVVNQIIALDKDYEQILLRKSSWGYEYEYWRLYELKDLLRDLKKV